MIETSNFLTVIETVHLQALNKWWYVRAIHRLAKARRLTYPPRPYIFYVCTKHFALGGNFLAYTPKIGLIRQDLDDTENISVHFVGWCTIQAGRNLSFQFLSAGNKCRVILFNARQKFRVENRVDAKQERILPILVNAWDSFVFLIGGFGKNNEFSAKVWRYDLANDTYSYDMPGLNYGRVNASGCVLGGFLYIAGGTGDNDIFLNSIERLNIASLGQPKEVLWQLIETPIEIFSAR